MSEPTPLPAFGYIVIDADGFPVPDAFTAEQMTAYGRAEYLRGLEDAARVCEGRDSGQRLPIDEEDYQCAEAIRELKGQE